MILYAPKLTEKGWARYLENAFELKFNKLFKSKEKAVEYASKWLEFEYSMKPLRIPTDLEITCDEFLFEDDV